MDKEHNEELQKKALEQLKSGKSLFDKDGAVAPLLKNFIDKVLDAMHFKVRDDGKVVHKALYNILGINKGGIYQ